jgi:hypothetical protein
MCDSFHAYLSKIELDLRGGKATELTYRSSLEELIESLGTGVQASSDPKHTRAGAPDFIIERRGSPLGYIETKDIGEDLDVTERSDQLKRYRFSLANLVLTDYLEFRWYVNGQLKYSARIASVSSTRRLIPDPEGVQRCHQLLSCFLEAPVPIVASPKELAERLASLTHITRDLLIGALREEGEEGLFHRQLDAFRRHLIPGLKPSHFADLYAQTMAYGLFAARIAAPIHEQFTRAHAYLHLPPSNPFLRKLFLDIGEELDATPIAPFLDDIVSLLNRADMAEILKDFGRRTRTEDPVVHFYETFLAAYDPKLRKSRGVYYTPEPVVSYIVTSVDHILRTAFDRPLGLADPQVLILDPAVGTATFLYYTIQRIHESMTALGQAGAWASHVHSSLLGRLFGFELLMAPYAVAHLKLAHLLGELGYKFSKHERLAVYLTDTLEPGATTAQTLGLAGYLSEEGAAAAQVKSQAPVMVVLGNPPYANYGMQNKGPWIKTLLKDYKVGLKEKKLNLDDDFIKFIRFGQWRIDKTGQGILAFITNNTYIDGLTHRRMRESLLQSFDTIYILNLHGSSKKKEVSPDRGKDENVFDIQQGVAIGLFIKRPSPQGPPAIFHADLWGTRAHKYSRLMETTVHSTEWTRIAPEPPRFLFVPAPPSGDQDYQSWPRLDEAMSEGQNAIKTDRDELFIDFDRSRLESRMKEFYSDEGLLPAFRERYRIENSSSYDILDRRKRTSFQPLNIRQFLYRPFDMRWIYYSPGLTSRPAWRVMRHMISGQNLGLLATRQTKESWAVLATSTLCGHKACAAYDINSLFPLYSFPSVPDGQDPHLPEPAALPGSNFTPAFTKLVEDKITLKSIPYGRGDLKAAFGPEDILCYLYAIFYSPAFRSRYESFLASDFPRIPLTSDPHLFAQLVRIGRLLLDLHLMRSPALDALITTFPASGSNAVQNVSYAAPNVWINPTQSFGGLPAEVWQYQLGGYQVAEKWLKDRQGTVLGTEDILHYQRIIVALRQTLHLQLKIDTIIPGWPLP